MVNDNCLIYDEWFDSKTPDEISMGSHYKVKWKCRSCNGVYRMRLRERIIRKQGCPYCAGKRVLKGFNDLLTLCPDIAAEWDYDKNKADNLGSPSDYTAKSGIKAWWHCCNITHDSFKQSIIMRTTRKRGCPQCSGRKPVKGINDLATIRPDLIIEWDYEKNKNEGLGEPSDYTPQSNKKTWWRCIDNDKHTSYMMTISHKYNGEKCPYCQGKVLIGVNDVITLMPEIAKQAVNINDIRNKTIGSNAKILWKCEYNHTWVASIVERCGSNKTGCPYCSHRISKGEQELIDYIKTLVDSEIQTSVKISRITGKQNKNHNKELDVYINDYRVAFEYNGLYWHNSKHKNKNYHYDKWKTCYDNNIKLIQIWEDDWFYKKNIIKNYIIRTLRPSSLININPNKLEISMIHENNNDNIHDFICENSMNHNQHADVYVYMHDGLNIYAVLGGYYDNDCFIVNDYAEKNGYIINNAFKIMINYIIKHYLCNHNDAIKIYSDNDLNNSAFYENNGFRISEILGPVLYYHCSHAEHSLRTKTQMHDSDSMIWNAGEILMILRQKTAKNDNIE